MNQIAGFICAAFIVLLLLLGGICTVKREEALKRQAIERGYAEYLIDIDGKTTWKWKDK